MHSPTCRRCKQTFGRKKTCRHCGVSRGRKVRRVAMAPTVAVRRG